MHKALILGCGKVGNVTLRKCCENSEVFNEICLSGKTKAKCDLLKKELSGGGTKIISAHVDVMNHEKTLLTVKIFKPDVVINLAPAHLNLKIMDICLQTRSNYIDASFYYPKGSTVCGLREQLEYSSKFEKAGLTAIVGCGFNPGVTNAFTSYATNTLFDTISSIDVIDANAGKNGHPFLMNSHIGKNIREVSSPACFWRNGEWETVNPLEVMRSYSFPEVGKRKLFLINHEVLESLQSSVKDLKELRYYCAYKRSFLAMVKNLKRVGMTSGVPIQIDGCKISPLGFLGEVMPNPEDLAATTKGKTGIGCIFTGTKNGQQKSCMLYSTSDHAQCYEEMKASANDSMAGIPVMLGARLLLDQTWKRPGVSTVEAFDPEPFLTQLKECGLDWKQIDSPEFPEE